MKSSKGTATHANLPGPASGSARAAPLAAVLAAETPSSFASAPAAASSAGVTTSARGAVMLAEAVVRGVDPMREELQRVTTSLNELQREVHHLRMGYETPARGHEHVIMSMTMARGDCTKAFEGITASLQDLRICMRGASPPPQMTSTPR